MLSDCGLDVTTPPWLETNASAGRPGKQTTIGSTPFTIGRGDVVDLKIDSKRVSRNHATIVHEPDGYYYVRDLDSTNGISVNGKRVRVWRLSDGDMLTVADVEFVFRTGQRAEVSQKTEAASRNDTVLASQSRPPQKLEHLVRHLNESTSLRTVGNLYQPIISLDNGDVWGYEAVAAVEPGSDQMSELDSLSDATDCPLTRRRRKIHRLIGTEEMRRRFPDRCLLMSLTVHEVRMAKDLREEMRHLCFLAPRPNQIVLGIPVATLAAGLDVARLCPSLHYLGVRMACIDVSDVRQLARTRFSSSFDFLRVSSTLVRGIDRSLQRQERLQAIVDASQPLGAKIIAGGMENEAEAEVCIRLGCQLAQGDHFQTRHRSPSGRQPETG
jgi:EAL domain-containing protein (putative c-di-GMP-specific phosphodiesterase class I)